MKIKLEKIPASKIFLGAFFILNSSLSFAAKTSENKNKENTQEAVVETKSTSSKPSKHSLGIGLGQTFLMGELNQLGDDKITGELFYSYRASYSFDFVTNFHYTSHSLNNKETELASINMGIKSKVFDFDNFSPYVLGGLGFYRPKVKRYVNGALVESDPKYVLGVNLGFGVELRLNNRVSMGILGHFHKPFNSEQDNQPAVKGTYSKLLIMAMYTF
jgi:hypothetical protein